MPDYTRLTPFLKKYMEIMGWDDLNWLEDVHMGYEEGRAAVFDRNINGWVTVPKSMKLPDNQQDRDMIARELLIKFQMSPRHPMVDLNKAYREVLTRRTIGGLAGEAGQAPASLFLRTRWRRLVPPSSLSRAGHRGGWRC